MGIDRAAIATAIFNGTRTPATSVIAPTIDGSPQRRLPRTATSTPPRPTSSSTRRDFDRSKKIELWFNAGAGQDAFIEAVGNQLRQNLGVDFVLKGDLAIPEYMPLAMTKGFTGPFRAGWTMDYPSPQNYLEPLYSSSALPPGGMNLSFYSNPVFDQLVDEGNQAPSNAEAIAKYNQAEDVLLEDMPIIPMFFQVEQSVFSAHVVEREGRHLRPGRGRRGHRQRLTSATRSALHRRRRGCRSAGTGIPGGVLSRSWRSREAVDPAPQRVR